MDVPATHDNIDAVMDGLRREFIDSAHDMLMDTDQLIRRMSSDIRAEDAFLELRRNIHTIKGQGGTFGFPLITTVAHLLEDFIDTVTEINNDATQGIQAFVDQISALLDRDAPPTAAEEQFILHALPNVRATEFSDQIVKDLRALVVMPESIQRKIIGQELVSCGFRLNFASTAVSGLEAALAFPPDIVLSSMEIQGFTGSELAKVFHSVRDLTASRFILITSHELEHERMRELPEGTRIIQKNANFAEQLVDCLMAWGIFGAHYSKEA